MVGVQLGGTGQALVKYENKETNPDVRMTGGDENFLLINGYGLQAGRNFSRLDIESGRNVCLLGMDVAKNYLKKSRKCC